MKETMVNERKFTLTPNISKVGLRNNIQELIEKYEATGTYNYLIMAAMLRAYYLVLGGQKGIIIKNIDREFVTSCKQAFIKLQNESKTTREHILSGELARNEVIQLIKFINFNYFGRLKASETVFMNKTAVIDSAMALFCRGRI